MIQYSCIKRSKYVDILGVASIYPDQELYKFIFIKTVVPWATEFLFYSAILS